MKIPDGGWIKTRRQKSEIRLPIIAGRRGIYHRAARGQRSGLFSGIGQWREPAESGRCRESFPGRASEEIALLHRKQDLRRRRFTPHREPNSKPAFDAKAFLDSSGVARELASFETRVPVTSQVRVGLVDP
jgi:hypothetical protein